MAFKMKGFSPFTKKADGWRPHVVAGEAVAKIEKKQERLDKRAAKGKDVSGAQGRLDKRSERIYDREISRAERKERKADKKLEKGKGKQAARKKYKAGKIREAVSPLKKGPKKSRLKKIWEGLQEVGADIKSTLSTGLTPDQQASKMWHEMDKQDPRRKLMEGRKKKNKSLTKVKGNKGNKKKS